MFKCRYQHFVLMLGFRYIKGRGRYERPNRPRRDNSGNRNANARKFDLAGGRGIEHEPCLDARVDPRVRVNRRHPLGARLLDHF